DNLAPPCALRLLLWIGLSSQPYQIFSKAAGRWLQVPLAVIRQGERWIGQAIAAVGVEVFNPPFDCFDLADQHRSPGAVAAPFETGLYRPSPQRLENTK